MTMRLIVALSLISTIVWTIAGADAVPTGFFGNHNLTRGKVIPSAAVTVNGAQASALLDDDVTTAECLRFDHDRPATITFRFDKARLVTGVSLVGLHAKSLATAQEHGRIAALSVTTDGGTAGFELRDHYELAVASPRKASEGRTATDEVELSPLERLRTSQTLQVGRGPNAKVPLLEPVPTKTVVLEIKRIEKGTKHPNVCIGRIQLLEK